MRDGRSPWAVAGATAGRVLRFAGLSALYVLRLLVDRRGTSAGIRAAILNATPLPHLEALQDERQDEDEKRDRERRTRKLPDRRRDRAGRGGSKTTRFLQLVTERHGDLAAIPLDQVSRIATALAPEADLHPASARTALLGAVRAALPAGEGDAG
jgi:hypothetical protein